MRIGKTIIIPAVLALGAAGSILASSAAAATAAQAATAQVKVVHGDSQPNMHYHA
jgi:hypothetical protein